MRAVPMKAVQGRRVASCVAGGNAAGAEGCLAGLLALRGRMREGLAELEEYRRLRAEGPGE